MTNAKISSSEQYQTIWYCSVLHTYSGILSQILFLLLWAQSLKNRKKHQASSVNFKTVDFNESPLARENKYTWNHCWSSIEYFALFSLCFSLYASFSLKDSCFHFWLTLANRCVVLGKWFFNCFISSFRKMWLLDLWWGKMCKHVSRQDWNAGLLPTQTFILTSMASEARLRLFPRVLILYYSGSAN